MTTHTGLAATYTGFALSLGDVVLDTLSGLRQRVAGESNNTATGFKARFQTGASGGASHVAKGAATATVTVDAPSRAQQEKAAAVTGNNGRNAGASIPAQSMALTSAEQDRLDVQAALAGSQAAFAALVARYQSAVYNMAYRMLGDPTEAEDAAQEVFVRAWNQLRTFQLDKRFSTWLLSIASHHCIDVLRRRKPSAPLDGVALFIPSDAPEPDELALRGEQREMVQRLLNKLPEKYRNVTVLRYYYDLSYDEIARVTGLTESAVKTQLHRARRMLAEHLMASGAAPAARATNVDKRESETRKEVRQDDSHNV